MWQAILGPRAGELWASLVAGVAVSQKAMVSMTEVWRFYDTFNIF
jgi:hypothetical protein